MNIQFTAKVGLRKTAYKTKCPNGMVNDGVAIKVNSMTCRRCPHYKFTYHSIDVVKCSFGGPGEN